MTKSLNRRAFLKGAVATGAVSLAGIGLASCAPANEASEPSAEEEVEGTSSEGKNSLPLLSYTQYSSGGVPAELNATILFESSNSTFTKYQVGFTSCTCRDAASNYSSVVYIELLNTKETADESSIRAISFSQNEGYGVGFWGDSDPIHNQPTYTKEYMDEVFVQKMVGKAKAEFDAWEGYGNQIEGVAVDTVSGATVSTSNIMSVIKALFAYHAENYY